MVLVELLGLVELELELRAPLELPPLLLLGRLALALPAELPLELRELLAPELDEELDEGLLRPELPPPEPELTREEPGPAELEEVERDEPELCM